MFAENRENVDKIDIGVNLVKPSESDKNLKPSKPSDWIIYIIIGLIVSIVNMMITAYSRNASLGDNWEDFLWGYLIIIFLMLIPAIILAVIKRPRGYAYMLGYIIGGIIESIRPGGDLEIGVYTIFVGFCLFLILYLIFWKIWRSLSSVKFEK